ncbi:MAG: TfoX/Sxy family DNA transformation protein [Pseudomonadota bacterium]|nr:TfoX/Sxy family DNA transformation protein [Pseudomonadota bacterium]
MNRKQQRVSELCCLGPASERMLETIGILTRDDLQKIGPVQAYLELEQHLSAKPSLNLLYAMTLALEDRPWSSLTKDERVNLIMEVEAWHDLQQQTVDEIEK